VSRVNRREVKLSEVCQIQPPKSEVRLRLKSSDAVTFAPMESLGIGRKSLLRTSERPLNDVAGSYTYFANNDVLLAKITPCFENGKIGIASGLTNGAGFGSSEYIVLRPSEVLTSGYLYYFLSRESFRTNAARYMTGTAGQKRITRNYLESCLIPIPLLDEQHRIVKMLDESLEGIERARINCARNLQKVRGAFESYRDAIFVTNADSHSKRLDEVASFRNGVNFTKASRGQTATIIGVKDFRDRFSTPTEDLESVMPFEPRQGLMYMAGLVGLLSSEGS
jgi:type I restriction enzyme S subunit